METGERRMTLGGKEVTVRFVVPVPVLQFLKKNNVSAKEVVGNYAWEACIEEDVSTERPLDFSNATLIVNYVHFARENCIRISPEKYASGTAFVQPTWSKGTMFKNFTIGYALFPERGNKTIL